MNEFELQKRIGRIDSLKNAIEGHKESADKILDELHKEFTQQGLNTEQIERNELQFECLGLKFVTRTEISFDSNIQNFRNGNINTYYIDKDDEEELILSYDFDKIGNVNSRHLINEFSKYYFVDFFEKMIAYAIDKELRFPIE